MFKITAIVSLMLIGSTLWAASLSCDSCGSECTSACGTRHFRSCCFNYLRKKRVPDSMKFLPRNYHDWTPDSDQKPRPYVLVDDASEPWTVPADFRVYQLDDVFENRPYEQ